MAGLSTDSNRGFRSTQGKSGPGTTVGACDY